MWRIFFYIKHLVCVYATRALTVSYRKMCAEKKAFGFGNEELGGDLGPGSQIPLVASNRNLL